MHLSIAGHHKCVHVQTRAHAASRTHRMRSQTESRLPRTCSCVNNQNQFLPHANEAKLGCTLDCGLVDFLRLSREEDSTLAVAESVAPGLKFRGGKRGLEHCVLYKSPGSLFLGTSQTAGCASWPSGVHPFSCPCSLVNTFQMSLMEIMCGFGPQRLQTVTTRLSQKTLAVRDTHQLVPMSPWLQCEGTENYNFVRIKFPFAIVGS